MRREYIINSWLYRKCRGGACAALYFFALCLPASGQSAFDRADELETKILVAKNIRERIACVDSYLAFTKSKTLEYRLSQKDRERLEGFIQEAQKEELVLVPLVGKYNILLCPKDLAKIVDERRFLPFLDVSYILLKHLFGFSPVEKAGYRIIHRYDFATARVARSTWGSLNCQYGYEDWKEWLQAQNEWPGNLIHEMTHCFAGPSPGKLFIESFPNSGEGWPKWTPLYIYAHFPKESVLQIADKFHREEYVQALQENFRRQNKDFWKIDAYNPIGGLLVLFNDVCESASPNNPHSAISKTFHWLNEKPDTLIEHSPALALTRFLSVLERFTAAGFWKVLEKFNCPIAAKDTANYRIWEDELLPQVLQKKRTLSEKEMKAALQKIDSFDQNGKISAELEEKIRQALKKALSED